MAVDLKILGQGAWSGHPSGAFEVTEKHIDAAISQFDMRGLDVPVDMQHEENEAFGWIKSLFKKAGELWASIEWTKETEGFIESEKFKYTSPTLIFDAPDPTTGKPVLMELFGLALTNYPFMNDLSPLSLQYVKNALNTKKAQTVVHCSNAINTNEFIDKSLYIIKGEQMPADLASITDGLNAAAAEIGVEVQATPTETIAKMMEYFKAVEGIFAVMPETPAGAPPSPEEAAELIPEMAANHKLVSDLTTEFKCESKDLKAKFVELSKVPNKMEDKDKQIVELSTRVETMETESKSIKADSFITKNEAKIIPADRDYWKDRHIADPKGTEKYWADKKAVIADHKPILDKKEFTKLTPAQQALAKAANLTEKQWIETRNKQLNGRNA